jgi:hypothetical protein
MKGRYLLSAFIVIIILLMRCLTGADASDRLFLHAQRLVSAADAMVHPQMAEPRTCSNHFC